MSAIAIATGQRGGSGIIGVLRTTCRGSSECSAPLLAMPLSDATKKYPPPLFARHLSTALCFPWYRKTIAATPPLLFVLGVQKTDPVRFKWGFGEGLWKTNLPFTRLPKILYLRGEICMHNAHFFFEAKRALFRTPFNWTGSVFPLLFVVTMAYRNFKERIWKRGIGEKVGNGGAKRIMWFFWGEDIL